MSGRNEPCECGSGLKFKKCCGARGRIQTISVAEELAYREARLREPPKKSKSLDAIGGFLSFTAFAASANMASFGRSKSNRRRK